MRLTKSGRREPSGLIAPAARAPALAAAALAACLVAASCASGSGDDRRGAGTAGEAPAGEVLALTAESGPLWTTRKLFMRMTPSFAGWVETPEGDFVGTLTVSGKASSGGWMAAPSEGRPEALPVWNHASAASASGGEDAVSGASSASGASGSGAALSLTSGEEYAVFFEINRSFDYNEAWPKGAKKGEAGWSGVNGQPSLVYGARFTAGKAGRVELKVLGHGSVDGSDGLIDGDLSGITTAFDAVKDVYLEVF